MTDHLEPDDHAPDHPGPDEAAARDAELARHLAVPPLPELTRRRLVRAALDAPAVDDDHDRPGVVGITADGSPGRVRRRPPWWAAAAAALVVVGAVAGAVLAISGGSGDRPTAARAPTSAAAGSGAPNAAKGPGPETAPPSTFDLAPRLQAGTTDLGELGEVADRATLRQRVVAAEARPAAESTFGAAPNDATGTSNATPPAPTSPACPGALAAAHPDFGPVLASGTATYHGAPATVVTARTASGDLVAVVIVDSGCVVKRPLTVGP